MLLGKKWYARAALVLPLLLSAAIVVPIIGDAGASVAPDVNTAGMFQLDGNVTGVPPPTVPPPYDWANLFTAAGTRVVVPDLVTSTFIPDPPATADFALTQNTKDTANLTTWDCKVTPVTPKNELQNAYAAAFIAPSGPAAGDLLLYMGLERGSVNGTSNAGFWLLRNRVVCDKTTATPNFGKFVTPTTRAVASHANGDEFLFASFTSGGTTVFVQLFRWNTACTGSKSEPAGCVSGSSTGGLTAGSAPLTGKQCDVTNTNLCGISNATAPISTPWAPGTVGTNGFFEAGVDLTKELGLTFLAANGCFSTFMADTRSSGASVGNEGHDFSLGSFSLCRTPTLTTTQSVAPHVTGKPTTGVVGTAKTGDTATLTGYAGSVKTETVTFKLFGPFAPSAPPTTCPPTRTSTLVFSTTGKLDATGKASATDPTALTKVGTYYWVAYYPGDTGSGGLNKPTQSGCTAEPVTVVKASPSITTAAGAQTPAPGVVGSPVTTSDSATLSTAFEATGTVTFELLPPNGPTAVCGAPAVTLTVTGSKKTSVTGAIAATAASTPTVSFTPTVDGTYHWVATYPGDANNDASTGLGTCDVTTEAVVVTKATPTLSTIMFLGDIANLTGGYEPAGTIVFTLYPKASCTPSTPTAVSWTVPLTAGTASTLETLVSTVTKAELKDGTTYSWQAKYVDSSGLNKTVTTACGTETVTTGPAG